MTSAVYSAWRYRLGIKISATDILDLHLGTEYTTEQEDKVKDSGRLAFNLGSSRTFNLTAGFNARISDILFAYTFIYRNEFYDYQSMNYYATISHLVKSNPIEHRLMLRHDL